MSKLSAKHFVLFIFGVTFISFKTYSSLFIAEGGRDTWIYTIIAYIVFLAFAMYLIYIMDSRKTYDLTQIFTLGLSKTLGNILLFIFSIGLFLAALESATVEANAIKTNFFIETPDWYILIFFLLPSFFIIGKKFTTLLIFVILTSGSLILNFINLSLVTEKYKHMKYILPVFGNGIGIELINTSLLIIGSLSAFVIALPFLKYLNKNNKLKKHSLIALAIVGFICVYSIIGTLATFGPLRASNIFYPEYVQSQLIQIGGFLEFGEFFFVFQTVIGMFVKYIIATCGIYLIYEKQIKSRKAFITIYSIAIFIFACFLSRNNYTLFNVLKYYQYINLVTFVLVPLIAFLSFQINVHKIAKK